MRHGVILEINTEKRNLLWLHQESDYNQLHVFLCHKKRDSLKVKYLKRVKQTILKKIRKKSKLVQSSAPPNEQCTKLIESLR